MKNLRFGILPLLFGFAFGLNLVNGDVIWPNVTGETNYPRNISSEFYETYEFHSNVSSINWYVWYVIEYLIVCYVLSFFFMGLIFKKLGEKTWKGLIPFYNLYILFKFVGIKKIFFWLIWIGVFIRIAFWYRDANLPKCNCDFQSAEEYYYADFSWAGLLSSVFGCIAGLYFSLLMFILFYRLFRKFGWKKWTSILGTIFFPIGACILGFGKYEYQGEKLENKEENN